MVDFLEQVVRPRRLKIAVYAADAIQRLKRPLKTTKVRFFIGLCNVSHTLIQTSPALRHLSIVYSKKINLKEFRILNEKGFTAMMSLQE